MSSRSRWSGVAPIWRSERSSPVAARSGGDDIGVPAAGHGAPGVRYDQDALHAEQVHSENAADQRVGGDVAARRTEDLGVTDLQADHLQGLDPRIHARHHGDAGVGDAVEATEGEPLPVVSVPLEQVVELVGLDHG